MIMIIVLTMICCFAVAYLLDHLEDLNSQRSEPIELLRLIWRDKGVEGVNKSVNPGGQKKIYQVSQTEIQLT